MWKDEFCWFLSFYVEFSFGFNLSPVCFSISFLVVQVNFNSQHLLCSHYYYYLLLLLLLQLLLFILPLCIM